jgi:hypothetical protein
MSATLTAAPYRPTVPPPAAIDGRTVPGRRANSTRVSLVLALGGHPTVAQRLGIERAVTLAYRLAQMDAALAAGEMVDDAAYLGAADAYAAALRALGLEPAA